jgi:hypothetical protein
VIPRFIERRDPMKNPLSLLKKFYGSQALWFMPLIPAVRRLRQEDHVF